MIYKIFEKGDVLVVTNRAQSVETLKKKSETCGEWAFWPLPDFYNL